MVSGQQQQQPPPLLRALSPLSFIDRLSSPSPFAPFPFPSLPFASSGRGGGDNRHTRMRGELAAALAATDLLARSDLFDKLEKEDGGQLDGVQLIGNNFNVGSLHSVYCVQATSPSSSTSTCSHPQQQQQQRQGKPILLVPPQSFDSSVFLEHQLMQWFAAAGHRCVAIDLPGTGRTVGPTLSADEKPTFLLQVLSRLGLSGRDRPIVVAVSQAAQYVLPLIDKDVFGGLVAVGLSIGGAGQMPRDLTTCTLPVLALCGEMDTSVGQNSVAALAKLPFCRALKIPRAGHVVFLANPLAFRTACANFFELIAHNAR